MTNIYGGDIAVLDLVDAKVVARIVVGEKPNGISFSTVVPSARPPATIELPLPHEDDEGAMEEMDMG